MTEPVYLTVDEAADRLNVGRKLIYDLCKQNKFPHVKLGKIIRVPVNLLDAWERGAWQPEGGKE